MTVNNPPSVIQTGSHTAEALRRLFGALTGNASGVLTTDDFVVAQALTPAMSVLVAPGQAFIAGDESAAQGTYHVTSDASETLTIAASDPTNARIDLIVAKVQDTAYSGVVDAWSLAVVTGTPAGSPVAPTAPDNAIVLARVAVAAAATTITNANITDARPRARGDWASAWGSLGTATATSSTNVTNTVADVTGLTVTTGDLPAGRLIRTTVVGNVSSGTNGNVAALTICDGSNSTLVRVDSGELQGSTRGYFVSWVETTAGGAVTRKLRAQRVVGASTCTLYADSTRKAQIVIEDIGPA